MTESKKYCFVDSNLWIYLLTEESSSYKLQVMQSILQIQKIFVSDQVVNEINRVLLEKYQKPSTEVQKIVDFFYYQYDVISFSREIIQSAISLKEKYGFRYWDSLIVASALNADIKVLYSEDMHHGLVIEKKLTILNPFQKS